MEEIKRKEKRVGTYTFGVMLILIGISVIVMTFTKLDFIKYILMLWPFVLIGFGIEIIYLNSKADVKVKIDFASIILMCAVLFFTGIFSIGNYFVNKVLYDDEVKSLIINQYMDNEYGNYMEKEVTIKADDKNKVKVRVIEDKAYKNSSYVRIKYKINSSKDVKLKDALELQDKLYDDFEKDTITLNQLPSYIEKVQITIHTDSMNNVHYDGNIIK